MRTNVIIALVLGVMIAVTLGLNVYASPTSFDAYLHDLETGIYGEDWGRSNAVYSDLKEDWLRRRRWLQFTKSTQTIAEMDRLVARLQALIRTESKVNAAQHLADLMEMWKDLKG